jgi:hypothetical protein
MSLNLSKSIYLAWHLLRSGKLKRLMHEQIFFTPRHSSLQCVKAKKNKTLKTTPLRPQAFSFITKLGKLMFNFSTFYFVSPISIGLAPTPKSLQPHTSKHITRNFVHSNP